MEPEKVASGESSESLTIDKNTAEQLLSLFKNVHLADVHFQSCQSAQFRMHVRSAYKAANVQRAFEQLADYLGECIV